MITTTRVTTTTQWWVRWMGDAGPKYTKECGNLEKRGTRLSFFWPQQHERPIQPVVRKISTYTTFPRRLKPLNNRSSRSSKNNPQSSGEQQRWEFHSRNGKTAQQTLHTNTVCCFTVGRDITSCRIERAQTFVHVQAATAPAPVSLVR